MEANQVTEHLQVIRTLMERSALYRRALAPIMLAAGAAGAIAAVIGLTFRLNSTRSFTILWLVTGIITVIAAFFIARRQAFKENEAFWSPPTRRVAQAMLPPLAVGAFFGVLVMARVGFGDGFVHLLPLLWAILYGCALHAAGFFIPRGVRLFGWIYIISALSWILFLNFSQSDISFSAHWEMGFCFGALHLAYGAYLYLTDKEHTAL
jgi:hypothetical protein